MNRKCNILIPIGCRSDKGLSVPIINTLSKDSDFNIYIIELGSIDNHKILDNIESALLLTKPDLVFIVGDRKEMTIAALSSFTHRVPVAHYYAGVITPNFTTLDCINRHCITLWSSIQFVESKICKMNVELLFSAIKKKTTIKIVGSSHLEDLKIDESLVPKEKYDLVLYNPTQDYRNEIITIMNERFGKNTIWIGPNPDVNFLDLDVSKSHYIWNKIKETHIQYQYYENLERPQFLGLLKNCERFISNSSAAYYEAPYFLRETQILQIGDRNKDRTRSVMGTNASFKIKEYLKFWWEEQQNG